MIAVQCLRAGASRGVVLVAAMAAATGLDARPYAVDDIIRTEAFGRMLVAPGGHWLVFEKQIALGDAFAFDGPSMEVLRTRLFRVDLAHPGEATPLIDGPPDVPTVAYCFSPRGSRLAVARLKGGKWTLGIVTIGTRAVRWLDVAPDYDPFRSTLAWISEDRLVAIVQPGNALPWLLRTNLQDAADLPTRWADTRTGRQPAVTAIGSGRFIETKPAALPTRLVDLDVITGAMRTLAEGDLQSLQLSPDGRHVALVAQGAMIPIGTAGPISQSTDVRQRRLAIIDLARGRAWAPCPTCDVPFYPPVWSPSGRQLMFFARQAPRPWSDGGPWIAQTGTSQAHAIALGRLQPVVTTRVGEYASMGMAWLGEQPIVFARRGADTAARPDWYLVRQASVRAVTANVPAPSQDLVVDGRGLPIMLASGRAWRLDTARARRILSKMTALQQVPDSTAIGSGQGRAGAMLLGWRETRNTLSVVVAAAGRTSIEGRGDLRPETASPRDRALVATMVNPNDVQSLVVQTPRAAVAVATINQLLSSVAAADPVAIKHRLPDGKSVTSWLYRPSPRADGTRPPLIVIPYAGREYGAAAPTLGEAGNGSSYTNVAALVGHGYAVLLPSMPALAPSDAGAFAFAGQVLSAVDAVLATSAADPDRVGLWGHSYGGYTAATIATQTNRFRAIIASNGMYDLTSYQGTFTPSTRMNPGYGQGIIPWAGWTETGQPALASTPWSDPARYIANSPIYHADKIATPLMLIAGDRDFVPLQQAEQLFSALYRQGKDATLVSYWGEGHSLVSPANIRDCYRRVFAWFDTHFADGPADPQPTAWRVTGARGNKTPGTPRASSSSPLDAQQFRGGHIYPLMQLGRGVLVMSGIPQEEVSVTEEDVIQFLENAQNEALDRATRSLESRSRSIWPQAAFVANRSKEAMSVAVVSALQSP